jgi:YggT family protein
MNIIWLALKTLGSLFVVACAMRAYLQALRLHPQNPVSRLIFQMTDWLVRPLRRLLPGFGGVDWASLLGALILSLILVVTYYLLVSVGLLADANPLQKPVRPFGWLVALAVLWLLGWCVQLAVVLLIVGVLLSWIAPMHPLKPVFTLLTSPMLLPFQRLFGRRETRTGRSPGFDFSPIGAFLMLQIAAGLLAEMESGVMRHLF